LTQSFVSAYAIMRVSVGEVSLEGLAHCPFKHLQPLRSAGLILFVSLMDLALCFCFHLTPQYSLCPSFRRSVSLFDVDVAHARTYLF
jgi:hypothetical protein